jgi:5-methylcytosine-specific restriction endonuclease McrA
MTEEKEVEVQKVEVQKIKACFERLEKLSTEELDQETQKCVLSEQRNVASSIAHLSEISRRKDHLRLGYTSPFDYCVQRLKLSEGSVFLRVQVANVARRFPGVLSALAQNRISLSVAGALAPHLCEDNAERLLSDCAGKTYREVQEYLVALKPRPLFEPGIRRKPGSLPAGAPPDVPSLPVSLPPPLSLSPPGRPGPGSPEKPSSFIQPAQPELYNFRFSADKAFKDKLLRAAEVLGIKNPQKNLAEVLERALDLTLERKDPQKKLERRRERERKRAEKERALDSRTYEKSRPEESRPKEGTPVVPLTRKRSRAIPSVVRELISERGDYQCQYRGPDGTRCTQRTGVQVDHIQAFSKFGKSEVSNLQLLCKAHNLFRVEEEFGEEFIRQKVSEKT